MNFPHHDPAWLERMYNNRALVPDHLDYLQRWWGVRAGHCLRQRHW